MIVVRQDPPAEIIWFFNYVKHTWSYGKLGIRDVNIVVLPGPYGGPYHSSPRLFTEIVTIFDHIHTSIKDTYFHAVRKQRSNFNKVSSKGRKVFPIDATDEMKKQIIAKKQNF